MKSRDRLIRGGELRSTRWVGLLSLALLVACGGGGSGAGTSPLGSGSGTTPLGSGAGTPPFGSGSGVGGTGLVGDGPRPTADAVVVVSDDAVQGTVVNARTGAALAGATVRFAATTLTSDNDGRYTQATATAAPRAVFEAGASSYETLYAPAEVLGTVPSVNLFRLTPYGTTADVTVTVGGTVTDTGSGAAVTLPANALAAAGGGSAPSTVGVRVTPIAVGTDPHLLSGDYTDDSGNLLESFGGASLGSTAPVQVASGAELTLRIPVSTRSSATSTAANLYRFDPSSGRWVQNGTATISGGAYNAAVTTFGQWMVGVPITSPVTVTGCVRDDNDVPAANVRVELEGISYTGTTQATTNAQGVFTLSARQGSRVIVAGRRGALLTNSVAKDVTTGAADISPCLTLPLSNAATMRLTWGAAPTDIDSHLRTPDGAHIDFTSGGSLTQQPFASLDVDDVTSFGPEVTTVRRPRAGIYRFYLHNFSRSRDLSAPGMTESPTRLELNYLGRTVVFSPPNGEGSAQWWHLFDLQIAPDCTMTLYRYNRWRADEPQNPNASTTTSAATECVPS